jgi:hypothetical protein
MASWLYHRTEPARIVSDDAEIQRMLRNGWADSPAKFTDEKPQSETPRRRERKEHTA